MSVHFFCLSWAWLFTLTICVFLLSRCGDYYKNDYKDNSPTSGQLKVYYDEGLHLHVKNQAYTFESQYHNARLKLVQTSEDEAVEALYKDSCEAIVISRLLNEREKKAFESKQFFPKYSTVAVSGVALITNVSTPLVSLTPSQIEQLLGGTKEVKDSLNNDLILRAMLDRSNSSVVHYLVDSVLRGKKFSSNCGALMSTPEAIEFVSQNKNTVAFIDFAWLSDVDDSLTKKYSKTVKFVGIKIAEDKIVLPSQSAFKLGSYPFTRNIYVMRKTGDFSLAKGFESFVAGPKGQLTFLKQGLLPNRQAERVIEVKFEEMKTQ